MISIKYLSNPEICQNISFINKTNERIFYFVVWFIVTPSQDKSFGDFPALLMEEKLPSSFGPYSFYYLRYLKDDSLFLSVTLDLLALRILRASNYLCFYLP